MPMLQSSVIAGFIESPLVRHSGPPGDDPVAWAALPDAALDFLVAACCQLGVINAFEFGSGRSTGALLKAAQTVTSLENSALWMERTVGALTEEQKARHHALVRPLRRHWCHLYPVLDWTVDAELRRCLESADLVLIDAPFHPAFRERTLRTALLHSPEAVIALDDTRIPTLARFCDRIAADNPAMRHARVAVGHGFDVFYRGRGVPLRWEAPPVETLKGWRRYLLARKYAPSLFHPDSG
ncbi:MAG TPA: hypothetical protein VMD31_00975 [Opitutaceae bacterium]|nr:hypothetical protein [Opitutaceae bacterium]